MPTVCQALQEAMEVQDSRGPHTSGAYSLVGITQGPPFTIIQVVHYTTPMGALPVFTRILDSHTQHLRLKPKVTLAPKDAQYVSSKPLPLALPKSLQKFPIVPRAVN